MAIEKAMASNYGVEANYWRVMKINIEVDIAQVTLVLFGWVDDQAANDGLQPLIYKQYAFYGPEFIALADSVTQDDETLHDAIKRVCEIKVLEQEEFQGGVIL